MRLALLLVGMLPVVAYVDVIQWGVPVLSGAALLLGLPVYSVVLLWAWVTKSAVQKQRAGLIMGFFLLCPALCVSYALRTDREIASEVRQIAQTIAQFKKDQGQFPQSLQQIPALNARYPQRSSHALVVHGRVVSYLQGPGAGGSVGEVSFSKLSYWSFGALQRQVFDVPTGLFQAPLLE